MKFLKKCVCVVMVVLLLTFSTSVSYVQGAEGVLVAYGLEQVVYALCASVGLCVLAEADYELAQAGNGSRFYVPQPLTIEETEITLAAMKEFYMSLGGEIIENTETTYNDAYAKLESAIESAKTSGRLVLEDDVFISLKSWASHIYEYFENSTHVQTGNVSLGDLQKIMGGIPIDTNYCSEYLQTMVNEINASNAFIVTVDNDNTPIFKVTVARLYNSAYEGAVRPLSWSWEKCNSTSDWLCFTYLYAHKDDGTPCYITGSFNSRYMFRFDSAYGAFINGSDGSANLAIAYKAVDTIIYSAVNGFVCDYNYDFTGVPFLQGSAFGLSDYAHDIYTHYGGLDAYDVVGTSGDRSITVPTVGDIAGVTDIDDAYDICGVVPVDTTDDVVIGGDVPIDVPVDVPADVPADVPVDVPADVPADVPVDVPADVPADVPVDVPIDVPDDVPIDVPDDVPIDVPVDVPIDVPDDVPIDVPDDIPIDVPSDNDGTGLMYDLSGVFPFCIPFDLYYCIQCLKVEGKAPVWEIPLNFGFVDCEYTIVIDMSDYETVVSVFRVGIVVMWVVGLAMITHKVIKW